MTNDNAPLRARLRAAVPVALKARDRPAVSALRSALAAVENAEAVEVGDEARAGAIEASPAGLGAAEVPRRALSEEEIVAIVRAEITERRTVAADYTRTGHAERAAVLLAEADTIEALLR